MTPSPNSSDRSRRYPWMFPAAATHLGYTLEQDADKALAPAPQPNRSLMVQLGRWRAANPEYPDANMLTQVAKRLLADCPS